jgi:hypothetical protein
MLPVVTERFFAEEEVESKTQVKRLSPSKLLTGNLGAITKRKKTRTPRARRRSASRSRARARCPARLAQMWQRCGCHCRELGQRRACSSSSRVRCFHVDMTVKLGRL